MDEKKKPSIVDVAKWAGVSTATVSRVINHNGGYSRETEEKVKKAVNECEFTPNANAIGLRTNKSRCIGVIVPDVTNEFFARIIQELDFYLLKHKYSLLICNSNEDYELENMHIRGLIESTLTGSSTYRDRMRSSTQVRSGTFPWFTSTGRPRTRRC